eukprot:CAMPEP_0184742598 /NCGR_PEP_ID=MMETSP0315-20130426/5545_1 /TAXON_ID=101924 /ORGANISM="Rhodosorus marinus, Strain UTEX LB 2760" /LENGTH=72 /DNA_ID=CAMNT_0027213491 /DNA_START=113 /DNA_END=331 /DNA_ORIENTATION=+
MGRRNAWLGDLKLQVASGKPHSAVGADEDLPNAFRREGGIQDPTPSMLKVSQGRERVTAEAKAGDDEKLWSY